ncbi:MAG: efflux RND transporter periplasmic adaptor subunit [Nitrospirota bacterium]|nr:efflux RND transporter periplasmic adaptor subunit [Nitrospirota bacterium]MDE3117607.1 efflux RND transporter periplasmic adaptor subunit [Nitrospirota bacterium]MDE3225884.1 efflux RND transporter periplasmic adaptor subunit [Nitrospirota bacterium]MDE3243483.1 efflux RND transporter periplasmic adaptor subunit [Nitrospirota bacterium]
MIVLTRLSVWASLVGLLFTTWILMAAKKQEPMPTPIEPPPTSPYATTVAASGIIEAENENVRIAPPAAGLITKVFVKVGDQVDLDAPLLQLDDRELRAQLAVRQAAIAPAEARIEEQRNRLEDLQVQYKRLQAVHDRRAVSEDDVKRTWYAMEANQRVLVRNEADLIQAVAQRDETKILLERLTVRAPRSGTVLQVNVRAGEYATPGAAEALLLLGETHRLQVRADVDEVNAPLVQAGNPGVAYLKGSTKQAIPLTFARIEPYIVPKKSLTGDNTERVDTRVLQIIYHFARPPFPVYAGQQVDVFIKRDGGAATPPPAQEPGKAP